MADLAMLARQVRSENTAFWRNPAAAFFTFVFPLIFLVIFNLFFGNEELNLPGGTTHVSTFYIPAIAALSVITACFTGLAMSISIARDGGMLKRTRGTPLPQWIFLLARVAHTTFIAFVLVAIVAGAGVLFYDVDLPSRTMPAFIVTLALGAIAFSSLGLAVSGLIPNADAAPPLVNAIVLPLLFISDIFIRADNAPVWINQLADLFPLKHLSLAMQTSFNPFETGSGFEPLHLAVLAAWGVAGLIVAQRFFTWEPRV